MFTSVLWISVCHPIVRHCTRGQNFWSEAAKTKGKVGHGKKFKRSSKEGVGGAPA